MTNGEAAELGRLAYIAYRSLDGPPTLPWDDLSIAQQQAFMWFGILMAQHDDLTSLTNEHDLR